MKTISLYQSNLLVMQCDWTKGWRNYLQLSLICEKFIYVKSAYKQPLDRELCVCVIKMTPDLYVLLLCNTDIFQAAI